MLDIRRWGVYQAFKVAFVVFVATISSAFAALAFPRCHLLESICKAGIWSCYALALIWLIFAMSTSRTATAPEAAGSRRATNGLIMILIMCALLSLYTVAAGMAGHMMSLAIVGVLGFLATLLWGYSLLKRAKAKIL